MYNRSISKTCRASGAGIVSDPRLISQVRRVLQIVCA